MSSGGSHIVYVCCRFSVRIWVGSRYNGNDFGSKELVLRGMCKKTDSSIVMNIAKPALVGE